MADFDFIFMLTHHDRTVANAADHVRTAIEVGVRHIGFKDVGLPFEELDGLQRLIRAQGGVSYLEVVSRDRDSELASVQAAARLKVDHLLGGTRVDEAVRLLRGTGIRYYPFPGQVSGHPSVLGGSMDEIVASARAIATRPGVDGLDLLAYRSTTNVPELITAVCAAVDKRVIVAGSIHTPEQVQTVRDSGAAAFTVGTAALDGQFPARSQHLSDQLAAILAAMQQRSRGGGGAV